MESDERSSALRGNQAMTACNSTSHLIRDSTEQQTNKSSRARLLSLTQFHFFLWKGGSVKLSPQKKKCSLLFLIVTAFLTGFLTPHEEGLFQDISGRLLQFLIYFTWFLFSCHVLCTERRRGSCKRFQNHYRIVQKPQIMLYINNSWCCVFNEKYETMHMFLLSF